MHTCALALEVGGNERMRTRTRAHSTHTRRHPRAPANTRFQVDGPTLLEREGYVKGLRKSAPAPSPLSRLLASSSAETDEAPGALEEEEEKEGGGGGGVEDQEEDEASRMDFASAETGTSQGLLAWQVAAAGGSGMEAGGGMLRHAPRGGLAGAAGGAAPDAQGVQGGRQNSAVIELLAEQGATWSEEGGAWVEERGAWVGPGQQARAIVGEVSGASSVYGPGAPGNTDKPDAAADGAARRDGGSGASACDGPWVCAAAVTNASPVVRNGLAAVTNASCAGVDASLLAGRAGLSLADGFSLAHTDWVPWAERFAREGGVDCVLGGVGGDGSARGAGEMGVKGMERLVVLLDLDLCSVFGQDGNSIPIAFQVCVCVRVYVCGWVGGWVGG